MVVVRIWGMIFIAAIVGLTLWTMQSPYALDKEHPFAEVRIMKGGSDVLGDVRAQFNVEFAITPEAKQRGLMFRQSLPEDQGMLFIYGRPQQVKMWMMNTYISLDMLFIDQEGTVVHIAENTVPLSNEIITFDGAVSQVLEVNAGMVKKHQIQRGDKVLFER